MHSEAWSSPEKIPDISIPDVSAETSEKLDFPEKVKIRVGHVLAFLGVLVGGVEGEHQLTRYEVYKHKNERGEVTYEHEDQETTRILDYIAGKEHMTDKDRLIMFREMLRNALKNNHKPTPPNIESMSRVEVVEAFINLFNEKDVLGITTDEDDRRVLDSQFEDIFPNYTYNPRIYDNLWKIEDEVGAPRIRWMTSEFQGRDAYYHYQTNTIHILVSPNPGRTSPNPDLNYYVAESAHAEQANDNHWYYLARHLYDFASTGFRAVTEQQSLESSYDELYDMPGTIEHDAHSIREPRLEELFKGEEPKTNNPPDERRRGPYGTRITSE